MTTATFKLTIAGAEWATAEKAELIRISRTVNAAAVAEIHIGGYSPTVGWNLVIPKVDDEVEIKLAASMQDAPKSVFKGWVIGLEVFGSGSSRRLVVRAIDAARDLMNGPAPSAHANTSFANVLKQLVSKVGSLSTEAHKSLNATQPYIAVTGTPMEFADNLCRRFGLSWWVDIAGRKLHLDRIQEPGDKRGSASAAYRVEPLTLEGRVDAIAAPSEVTVSAWDPEALEALDAKQATDAFVKRRGAAARVTEHPVRDRNEAQDVAAGVAARANRAVQSATVSIELHAGLELGDVVELTETYGIIDEKHWVTGFEHRWEPGQAATILELGGHDKRELADLVTERGMGDAWANGGAVVGVVSNNNDPDKLGRVKVKFAVLEGQFETGWARVLATRAGNKRGLRSLPSIDDEVLVIFEQGDPRRPYVLGGLWSKKNPPTPISGDDPGLETHVVTGADVVSFLMSAVKDSERSELETTTPKAVSSLVQDKGGTTITVDGEGQIRLATASDAEVTLKKDGSIELAGKSITLKASGDLKLEGQNVTMKAGNSAEVAGTSVKVKASGMGEVSAGGQLKVKGAATAIG